MIQLGHHQFPLGLFACPLAGITKRANRVLARRYGCEMVYTEMIKAAGLVRGNEKMRRLLKQDRQLEDVLGVQLAESDPDCMAQAVQMCADLNFDVIDINMGCPSKRIANSCAGAGMLRDLGKARAIMQVAVAHARGIPVTCKIRVGWTHDRYVHREVARMAQEEGLKLITVHGRTASDTYRDPVRYDLIKEVVEEVDIPVIGNGNVKDGPSAQEMLEKAGCAGVMVGRASQGNPWVFREIQHYLNCGTVPVSPEVDEVLAVFKEHFKMLVEDEGERSACLQIRKLGSWYLTGYLPKSFVHQNVFKISTLEDFESLIKKIEDTYLTTSI